MPEDNSQRVHILNLLVDHFNEEELKTLCFSFSPKIDYESLGGSGKAGNARELVAYCERRGQTGQLLEMLESRGLPIDVNVQGNLRELKPIIKNPDLQKQATVPSKIPTTVYQKAVVADDTKEPTRALVMKGGGVKGLAYVGALRELEKHYEFNWFVGTSAGAIAAVLLGAGYSLDELEEILAKKNFRDFLDAGWFGRFFNLFAYGGLYEATEFTDWIDELLAEKLDSAAQVTMKMLPNRVTVYACRRTQDTLVFDSRDPKHEDTLVAFAVRCSMAIPIFFTPQRDQGMRIFDGGMRNNYPVRALLQEHPNLDFIGLYLGNEHYQPKSQNRTLWGDLLSIWTETEDLKALAEYGDQTVIIDPTPIGTVDFDLSEEEKKLLIDAGQASAFKFLFKQKLLRDENIVRDARAKLEAAREPLKQKHEKRKRWQRIKWVFVGFALLVSIVLGFMLLVNSMVHAATVVPEPIIMTGGFNIAVAEFGQVTEEGVKVTAESKRISNSLFNYLDTEFQAADFGLEVQIAHANMPLITEDEEAEDLAQEINADFVVFGNIFVTGEDAELFPRFYVADNADVEELTGTTRLEFPIEFAIAELRFPDLVNTILRQRANILLLFTEGLVHLSADNLDAALRLFERAEEEAHNLEKLEKIELQGKEVINLLLGVTYNAQNDRDSALARYNEALDINPDYARAYIGIGNVHYGRFSQDWSDQAELEQALDAYNKALNASDHPEGAYVYEKVNISLGNAIVLQAQLGKSELFDEAIAHYQKVIAQYELTENERIRELAAVAHFGVGAAYERQGMYDEATKAYDTCIALTSNSDLKARAEVQLGEIEKNRGA